MAFMNTGTLFADVVKPLLIAGSTVTVPRTASGDDLGTFIAGVQAVLAGPDIEGGIGLMMLHVPNISMVSAPDPQVHARVCSLFWHSTSPNVIWAHVKENGTVGRFLIPS
jgi:hypothetical protein